jgi:hypothetical protein
VLDAISSVTQQEDRHDNCSGVALLEVVSAFDMPRPGYNDAAKQFYVDQAPRSAFASAQARPVHLAAQG